MRILLTNDDGIDSIGLHILARAMRPFGDVVIIAPDREFSGASAALGALNLIQPEVRRVTIEGIDESWSVSGPPALCVMFARLGAFGVPFDLVVSGINPGVNVGRSVYHSGTIGACISGRNGGLSGVAVSQAVEGFGIEGQAWDDMLIGQKWDTAAAVTAAFVEGLVADPPSEPVLANLNVPNVPIDQIKGWRHAEVGKEPPRRMTTAVLERKQGQNDVFNVSMSWGDAEDLPDHTDGGIVENCEVAITYLSRMDATKRDDLEQAERGLSRLLTR
jgi:5'-nucleotidase